MCVCVCACARVCGVCVCVCFQIQTLRDQYGERWHREISRTLSHSSYDEIGKMELFMQKAMEADKTIRQRVEDNMGEDGRTDRRADGRTDGRAQQRDRQTDRLTGRARGRQTDIQEAGVAVVVTEHTSSGR